jgi:hypothetical protein
VDDMMPRVAKMLGVSGSTIASVRATLLSEGVSEYDIYLTVKGAAMCYPHVADALSEEPIPDTEPQR